MNIIPKKSGIANSVISLVNTNLLRPLQLQYLHDNVIDSVKDSIKNTDPRIRINNAPTGSGKSHALVHVTIPSMIQQFPHIETVLFTSPDSGCTTVPYQKFKELWHNKVIINILGQSIRIRVSTKDDLNAAIKASQNNDLEQEAKSVEPVVDVVFATTQYVGGKWSDYNPNNPNGPYKLLPPQLIIVDEIHYGMGTPSWRTILDDQGRTNKNYKPHWLTVLRELAKNGSTVIGFTGTPTKSQQGITNEGKSIFKQLPVMSKLADSTAFVNGWTGPDPTSVYKISKDQIEQDLNTLNALLNKITDDTWEKAKDININKIMPGAFFKFGQMKAANGLPLKNEAGINGQDTRFKSWARSLGADYGIATCDHKEYQKTRNVTYSYPYVKQSSNVINRANDVDNFSVPVFLAVIQQGQMGWDIPRLKYISILTKPTGKNVTNMQQQLMARGNRLPFKNMHSHIEKANEIAALNISKEQKILLAEYVVFMCSTLVFFSRNSQLLIQAFSAFKQDTYTSEEGNKIYMDAIENYVPKQNISKFKAPNYNQGYNAGSLNQQYKKPYCEACLKAGSIDPVTGKTNCEINARKVREFERGQAFTDAHWDIVWLHTLALDHLNGDRTDYSPGNLLTRCPTNNGVKTYDAKDYLNKYDENGNRRASGQ